MENQILKDRTKKVSLGFNLTPNMLVCGEYYCIAPSPRQKSQRWETYSNYSEKDPLSIASAVHAVERGLFALVRQELKSWGEVKS